MTKEKHEELIKVVELALDCFDYTLNLKNCLSQKEIRDKYNLSMEKYPLLFDKYKIERFRKLLEYEIKKKHMIHSTWDEKLGGNTPEMDQQDENLSFNSE